MNWRYQTIDRDAMAQTQTNYLFDGVDRGNAASLRPSVDGLREQDHDQPDQAALRCPHGHEGQLQPDLHLHRRGQALHEPDGHVRGEPRRDVNSSHPTGGADGRLYYYQRERYGNGSNPPSQSHKAAARASYQLSPRTSFNAFVTYAQDKNDEMNIYQYDRDLLTPGLNLWTAPADNFLFTLGWTYNKVKSNANLCPPIFDG